MKYFKKEIVNDKKTEAVINEEGEIKDDEAPRPPKGPKRLF